MFLIIGEEWVTVRRRCALAQTGHCRDIGSTNASLLVFWVALIAAGVGKASVFDGPSFQHMMQEIRPYLFAFVVAGLGLTAGLWMVALPALRMACAAVFARPRLYRATRPSLLPGPLV